jgi:hypothetical protein
MFTLYLASVQFPVTFQRKPRAWHSSSAATTSAQPGVVLAEVIGNFGREEDGGRKEEAHSSGLLRCGDVDACWSILLEFCSEQFVCQPARLWWRELEM